MEEGRRLLDPLAAAGRKLESIKRTSRQTTNRRLPMNCLFLGLSMTTTATGASERAAPRRRAFGRRARSSPGRRRASKASHRETLRAESADRAGELGVELVR